MKWLLYLLLFFISVLICPEAYAETNQSQDVISQAEQEKACAQTLYLAGLQRPWSIVEIEKSIRFLNRSINNLSARPKSIEINQLLGDARNLLEQAEIELKFRETKLGAWSPYFGYILGQDTAIGWSKHSNKTAAKKAIHALFNKVVSNALINNNTLASKVHKHDVIIHIQDGSIDIDKIVRHYLNNNSYCYLVGSDATKEISLTSDELNSNNHSVETTERIFAIDKGIEGVYGVLQIIDHELVDNLHISTAQYTYRDSKGAVVESWNTQGYSQSFGYRQTLLIFLLLCGYGLQPIVVCVMRSRVVDSMQSLKRIPTPPFWSGLFAVVGGFVFSLLAREALVAIDFDLTGISSLPQSITAIIAIPLSMLILPLLLVYVLGSRVPLIGIRLGNEDMVGVLVICAWFGSQVYLFSYAAPVAGFWQALLLLLIPFICGAVVLIGLIHSMFIWGRSGRRWAFAALVLGGFGIVVTAILEVRGIWVWSIISGAIPLILYFGTVLLAKTISIWRSSHFDDEPVGVEVNMLREPPFILTGKLEEYIDMLVRHVLDNDSNDEAMECVWIDGMRGTGKTRIARFVADEIRKKTIENNLADDVKILFGDCNEPNDPEGDVPYEPLRQAFSELMGVHRFGNPAENAQKLQDNFKKIASSSSLAGSAIAVALDVSCGDENAFVAANEGMIADEMVEVLLQATMPSELHRGNRIVIIIDDIQWIDKETLSLLKILLEKLTNKFVSEDLDRKNKVAFIFTEQTDTDSNEFEQEVRKTIRDFDENRKLINLLKPPPLDQLLSSEETSEEWRDKLLSTIGCTERARRAIIKQFEEHGVEFPLHRLEFIKLAYEHGALIKIDNRYDVSPDINLEDIDPGAEYHESLYRELEGLDSQIVDVLHCCAIIGQRFQVSLIAKIFQVDILELLTMLQFAEERGLVVDRLPNDDIYEFKDKRIASVFRHSRNDNPKQIHQKIREYHRRYLNLRTEELENRYANLEEVPFTETLAMVAHAKFVSEAMPTKTIQWSLLASKQCEKRRLYGRAIEKLEPALSLVQNRTDVDISIESKIEILLLYAQLIIKIGDDSENAITSLKQAVALAKRLPAGESSKILLNIALLRATVSYQNRSFEEVIKIAKTIIDNPEVELWRQYRARFLSSISLDPKTQAEEKHNNLQQLLTDIEKLIGHEGSESDYQLQLLECEICNEFGKSFLFYKEDSESAKEYFERALSLNRSPVIANRKGEAIAHGFLGDVWQQKAKLAESNIDWEKCMVNAIDSYKNNLAISRETGQDAGILRMTSMLGNIELLFAAKGETEQARNISVNKARSYYEESSIVAVRTKQSIGFMFSIIGLIKIELFANTFGEGLELILNEAIEQKFITDDVFESIEKFITESTLTLGAKNTELVNSLQRLIVVIGESK
jgi:predicted ATPase